MSQPTYEMPHPIPTIGLFQKAKIRLSEFWQRMRFVVVFRLHGKGHKKFMCLQ